MRYTGLVKVQNTNELDLRAHILAPTWNLQVGRGSKNSNTRIFHPFGHLDNNNYIMIAGGMAWIHINQSLHHIYHIHVAIINHNVTLLLSYMILQSYIFTKNLYLHRVSYHDLHQSSYLRILTSFLIRTAYSLWELWSTLECQSKALTSQN